MRRQGTAEKHVIFRVLLGIEVQIIGRSARWVQRLFIAELRELLMTIFPDIAKKPC